jgi:hypothetical protein
MIADILATTSNLILLITSIMLMVPLIKHKENPVNLFECILGICLLIYWAIYLAYGYYWENFEDILIYLDIAIMNMYWILIGLSAAAVIQSSYMQAKIDVNKY